MPNASEIALAARNEFAADIIDAVVRENKVFGAFEALPLRGTQYDSIVMVTDAAAAGFLRRNQGYTRAVGALAKGRVNAARIGFCVQEPKSSTLEFDRQMADSGIRSPGYLQLSARSRAISTFANIEQQIFTGTVNDALGFLGLKEVTPSTTANTLALLGAPEPLYAKSFLNAAGTTADTASSIYTVNMGPLAVHLRIGGENGIEGFLKLGKITETPLVDTGDSTRTQLHYYAESEGYIGLNIGGSSEAFADRKYTQYDVRRAGNVTQAESGARCTEALLDQLIDMHPDGHKPNVIFMSKRSQRQLRDSIAATTGRTIIVPANQVQEGQFTLRGPLPDYHRGIRIIATDRISDTQALDVVA